VRVDVPEGSGSGSGSNSGGGTGTAEPVAGATMGKSTLGESSDSAMFVSALEHPKP
jgi:hypothetical protein